MDVTDRMESNMKQTHLLVCNEKNKNKKIKKKEEENLEKEYKEKENKKKTKLKEKDKICQRCELGSQHILLQLNIPTSFFFFLFETNLNILSNTW